MELGRLKDYPKKYRREIGYELILRKSLECELSRISYDDSKHNFIKMSNHWNQQFEKPGYLTE